MAHVLVVLIAALLLVLTPSTSAMLVAAAGKKAPRAPESPPPPSTAPSADAAPVEAQYLDTMLAHDKAAVDMAKLAKARSGHPELIDLAMTLFQGRRGEMEQLRAWHQRWYRTVPSAVNMKLPGMEQCAAGLDLETLARARGAEFDRLFLRMMLEHHEGSVRMSDWIKGRSSRRELIEFAEGVTRRAQREIEQMMEWQAAWAQPAPQP